MSASCIGTGRPAARPDIAESGDGTMDAVTPTSISDHAGYRSACARAARDATVFARFRQLGDYTAIVEPRTVEGDGPRAHSGLAEYADRVRAIAAYRPLLDRFRLNDRIGSPTTFAFEGLGRFSGATLRYIKILWDLEQLFGSLDGWRILEIGGGYGGQCAVISRRFAFASYDILDLPEPCELAARFLREAAVDAVTCVADPAALRPRYDLILSNYAFSELGDALRARYRETLLPRCARGYMLWNRMGFDVAQFGKTPLEVFGSFRDEMRALFQLVERPRLALERLTSDDAGRGTMLVLWGEAPGP